MEKDALLHKLLEPYADDLTIEEMVAIVHAYEKQGQ